MRQIISALHVYGQVPATDDKMGAWRPWILVDLYFLARRVREGELGIARSDMLDLPALG